MSPGYPFNIRTKSQRSRSQGHKVQKHISVEGDRVAGVSLHSIECQRLVTCTGSLKISVYAANSLLHLMRYISLRYLLTYTARKSVFFNSLRIFCRANFMCMPNTSKISCCVEKLQLPCTKRR